MPLAPPRGEHPLPAEVAARLDDLPVAHTHQIDAGQPRVSASELPSDDGAIEVDPRLLVFEDERRIRGDRAPQGNARLLAVVAGAVRVVEHAVFAHERIELGWITAEKRLVESGHQLASRPGPCHLCPAFLLTPV